MTRKDAADQLGTIATELSTAGDESAAVMVRGTIVSVMSMQSEVQHPRPPRPPADSVFSADLPADRLELRKDAVGRMREIASELSAAGDHNAAETVYASIQFVARPT